MSEAPTIPRPGPSAIQPALRILLADDSLTFRVATGGLLRRLGHRVDAVPDGLKALEAAARHEYDVILMDIRMPGMDGLEATRLLREQAGGRTVPRIIGVTANPPAAGARWYVEAGMDEVLTKPLSSPSLTRALDRSVASVPGAAVAAAERRAPAAEPAEAEAGAEGSGILEVVVDDLLCELRIWTDAEWARLPAHERPVVRVHYQGLGWVGAVPKVSLN